MFHCLMGATRHKILAVYYADGEGKEDGFQLARKELVGQVTPNYLPRLKSGECYKADCAKQDAWVQECKERDRKEREERERLKREEQERKEREARERKEREEREKQKRIERGEEEEPSYLPY
jgi:hypothetical protein